MTKKQASEIVGGLSAVGKMPCPSYGIPARACHVGGKLREVANSVCSGCYALKGQYVFPVVQKAQQRRLESIQNPLWTDSMVTLINGMAWFRWHDSGDLQSIEHFEKILNVCRQTPSTMHWLPTKEIGLVSDYIRANGWQSIPDNLVIRASGPFIDGKPPKSLSIPLNTSTVHKAIEPIGYACPAPKQGGSCGACRACWDKSVANVSYKKH